MGDLLVVEIENRSRAPFAVALIVRAAAGGRVGRIEIHDRTVLVDSRPAVLLPSVPGRVAGSTSGVDHLEATVNGGHAAMSLSEADGVIPHGATP